MEEEDAIVDDDAGEWEGANEGGGHAIYGGEAQ